jgi:hypothetical protein
MDDSNIFWGNNPNAFLQSSPELFPMQDMSFSRKMNAITRMIIVVFVGLLFIMAEARLRIVIAFVLTLFFIYMYHASMVNKEGFVVTETYPDAADLAEVFAAPTEDAPMGNVRPVDFHTPTPKKPAAPGSFPVVRKQMLEKLKMGWEKVFSKRVMDRVFSSHEGIRIFEESVRPFYSLASTTIPNDIQEFFNRTHPQASATPHIRGDVRGTKYNMRPDKGHAVL